MYFYLFIIAFFWFAQLLFKIEEKIHIRAVMLLLCLEVLGKDCSCETLGRGL